MPTHDTGYLGDLFSWNGAAWANVSANAFARGTLPSPRINHGFAPAAGKLFVFGGGGLASEGPSQA